MRVCRRGGWRADGSIAFLIVVTGKRKGSVVFLETGTNDECFQVNRRFISRSSNPFIALEDMEVTVMCW